MKPNTLRNIYIASVCLIMLILYVWISLKLDLGIKWWVSTIVFFLSILIGRFLYMFFSGINVFKVNFLKNDEIVPEQEFRLYVYFGFKKEMIDGSFDNTLGINDSDLRLLIYSQTTRHMLRNLIRNGVETDINYTFKNQNIRVTYIARRINLYFF